MVEQKTAEVHCVIKAGGEFVKATTLVPIADEKGAKSSDNVIQKDAPDLDHALDCAGEWTRCVARIAGPPYQMNVVNATSAIDGQRRARLCRNDYISLTYYTPAVLICAPYIRCTA